MRRLKIVRDILSNEIGRNIRVELSRAQHFPAPRLRIDPWKASTLPPKIPPGKTLGDGAIMSNIVKRILLGVALMAIAGVAQAQAPRSEPPLQPDPSTLDESAAPGANYDKADFRFWAPDGVARLD